MGDTQVLDISWHKQIFKIEVPATATIFELKLAIEQRTNVTFDSQKLLGLTKGKIPPDDTPLMTLGLKNPHKVMLMGIERKQAEEMASEEVILKQLRIEEEREERRRQRELEERRRLEEEEEQRRREEERERRAILQRQMEEERRQREAERRAVEAEHFAKMNMEVDHTASVSLYLQCYSSASITNDRLDHGDKIRLPPGVLEEAVNKKLPLPLNFRIEKEGHTSIAHCGVLEFDAPGGICYLPKQIMKKLHLDEGENVSLRNVLLPKGTFVQLKPHNASWIDLPETVREAILQQQLSKNYQTLTVNDTIVLSHNNKTYKFDVVKVRPPNEEEEKMDIDEGEKEKEKETGEEKEEKEKGKDKSDPLSDSDYARMLDAKLNGPKEKKKEEEEKPKKEENEKDKFVEKDFPFGQYAISILDADVTVDVLEPMEVIVPITNISFEKAKKIEEKGTLREGDYAYFALKPPADIPEGQFLIIKVHSPNGDPDLYVSNSGENRRPSLLAHTWQTQGVNGTDIMQIPPYDTRLKEAMQSGAYLYIAIHAYKGADDGTLQWNLSVSVDTGEAEGRVLGRASMQIDDGEKVECPTCYQGIPKQSFMLHEMRCRTQNFKCEKCGKVMSIKDKEKHMNTAHMLITCDCGRKYEPAELQLHKEYECNARLVQCLYCNLKVPLKDRGEHQGLCGNKTVTCTHCTQIFKRNAIKKHLVEDHGILPNELGDGEAHFIA